jgi:cell division protein ZapA (FtsZ GTPase activity inhibitor)
VSTKPVVAINIRGQEFRIRTDGDAASLQRVAKYLDDTMATVEKRTGTVDSLQLALLSALNLARELVELRESGGVQATSAANIDPDRFASLIELAESALEAHAVGH